MACEECAKSLETRVTRLEKTGESVGGLVFVAAVALYVLVVALHRSGVLPIGQVLKAFND